MDTASTALASRGSRVSARRSGSVPDPASGHELTLLTTPGRQDWTEDPQTGSYLHPG